MAVAGLALELGLAIDEGDGAGYEGRGGVGDGDGDGTVDDSDAAVAGGADVGGTFVAEGVALEMTAAAGLHAATTMARLIKHAADGRIGTVASLVMSSRTVTDETVMQSRDIELCATNLGQRGAAVKCHWSHSFYRSVGVRGSRPSR